MSRDPIIYRINFFNKTLVDLVEDFLYHLIFTFHLQHVGDDLPSEIEVDKAGTEINYYVISALFLARSRKNS